VFFYVDFSKNPVNGQKQGDQTMTQAITIESTCPECDAAVGFARSPLNGEIARCTECSVELEVTNTDPIVLEIAPEVEEDWGE
jgi:alpha-aminoadipate carrier protein LysW